MSRPIPRACPACGSPQVALIPRGFAGKTDTPDQYFVCQECGHITFEIVSVAQRDIRLYRYETGGIFRRDDTIYSIRRILKVGFDEFLLYLRPESVGVADEEADAAAEDEPAAADEAVTADEAAAAEALPDGKPVTNAAE